MIEPEHLMRLAIEKAKLGIQRGQSPFGCAIALDDQVIAVEHNVVWQTTDITAHAEIQAIRQACRHRGEILLTHCDVATTCEPCPMCMGALHWARVAKVYFGATIADADVAGFNELTLPASELVRMGGSSVQLIPNTLREECVELFAAWGQMANHRSY
jgi:tRNA(Arg) A34 adenosine deaminase TadA